MDINHALYKVKLKIMKTSPFYIGIQHGSISKEMDSFSFLNDNRQFTESLESMIRDTSVSNLTHAQIDEIKKNKKKIENYRVNHHHILSMDAIVVEEGVTVDVLLFMIISMCCVLLEPPRGCAEKVWNTNSIVLALLPSTMHKPPSLFTQYEISLAFALLFHWKRQIDWLADDFIVFVDALQWRASVILVEEVYMGKGAFLATHDFFVARALWACSTARCKMSSLAIKAWTQSSRKNLHRMGEWGLAHTKQNGVDRVAPHRLINWLVKTMGTWDGARLREAVSKAYKRWDLRQNETGCVVAFAGNNSLNRARGAMDTTEHCLHEMDMPWLIAQPSDTISPALLQLQEILILKLLQNALESDANLDFMETCVCLDNMRSRIKFRSSASYVLVEYKSGWVVSPTPHDFPEKTCTLIDAICFWYYVFFFDTGNDPMGLL